MARRRRKTQLTTGTAGVRSEPTFVSIIQPSYRWFETESQMGMSGYVRLPQKGEQEQAVICTPSLPIPDARFVKNHELLHANFSPKVYPAFRASQRRGIAPVSANTAEDIRIAQIGFKHGLWLEDAYITDELIKKTAAHIQPTCRALVEMFTHFSFQPSEGSWGIDSLDKMVDRGLVDLHKWNPGTWDRADKICKEFVAKVHAIFEKKRKGRKIESQVFRELAKAVELALREAAQMPIPESKPLVGDGGAKPEKKEESKDAPQSGSGSQDDEGDESGEGDEADSDDVDGDGADEVEAAPAPAAKKDEPKKEKKSRAKGPAADEPDDEVAEGDDDGSVGSGKSPLAPSKGDDGSEVKSAKNDALKDRFQEYEKAEEKKRQALVAGGDGVGEFEAGPAVEIVGQWQGDCNSRRWAQTKFCIASLRRPTKARVPKRGRAALEGAYVKHISRMATDGHCMVSNGRRPGGTLLIDVSGSMNWAHENTLALMEACPAITIALYSSRYRRGRDDRMMGVVTIICKNGRAVTKDWRPCYSGLATDKGLAGEHSGENACDGPALAWLIRQSSPRIWFSDGIVTGLHDDSGCGSCTTGFEFSHDAFRLARIGNVTRTMSVQVVKDIFGGRQKPDPVRRVPTMEEFNRAYFEGESWSMIMRNTVTKPIPGRAFTDTEGHDIDESHPVHPNHNAWRVQNGLPPR